MKKRQVFFFTFYLAAFMVICAADNAGGVANPGANLWGAPAGDFVGSLFRGVLGRDPSTENDRATVLALAQKLENKKTDRISLFWSLINSSKYKASRWADLEREYTIYWKTKEAQWPSGSPYLCHCYYFIKDIGSAGYLPNIQYTGLVDPPDKLTFGEAAALTPFYPSHDREVCPSAECNGGGATN